MKRKIIALALVVVLMLSIASVAFATTKNFYKTIYGGLSNLSSVESGAREGTYMVVQLNSNTQFNGYDVTFRAYKGTTRVSNAMTFEYDGTLPAYDQRDYWDLTTYTVTCKASISSDSTSAYSVISGVCYF